MRTIIISTHDSDEFERFSTSDADQYIIIEMDRINLLAIKNLSKDKPLPIVNEIIEKIIGDVIFISLSWPLLLQFKSITNIFEIPSRYL